MTFKVFIAIAVLICVGWSDAGMLDGLGKCRPTEEQISIFENCYLKVTGEKFDGDAKEKLEADKEMAQKVAICSLVEGKVIDEANTMIDEAMAIKGALVATNDENLKIVLEKGVKDCMVAHKEEDNNAKLKCMHEMMTAACRL